MLSQPFTVCMFRVYVSAVVKVWPAHSYGKALWHTVIVS